MPLIATAAAGLEAVVARELHGLGLRDTHAFPGGVRADDAGIADIPRLNLRLRAADRVRLVVGVFRATTFDGLFEGTRALGWADLLPRDAAFPVDGRSVKSGLASVPDCQAIVKRAVVEALRARYGAVERFPESGAVYRIEVALRDDVAVLSLDTSGDGLHKRGYRAAAGGAFAGDAGGGVGVAVVLGAGPAAGGLVLRGGDDSDRGGDDRAGDCAGAAAAVRGDGVAGGGGRGLGGGAGGGA